MHKLAVGLLLAACFMGSCKPPATNNASAAVAALRSVSNPFIDSLASQFLQDGHHVGLSIGVCNRNGDYTYHYGTVKKGLRVVPNDSTVYEIASLTKSFTGILLAQALISQKLKLSDPVTKYLDGFYPNLTKDNQPVTLLHLATHTSGLPKNIPPFPDGMKPAELLRSYGVPNRQSFLNDIRKAALLTVPGVHFNYSNAGTQLLSLVLENVYGKPYEELVQREICLPNGMIHTGCTVYDTINAAQGYDGTGTAVPGLEQWKNLPAAGYLKSTIRDMLRYIRLNMNESLPAVELAHHPRFTNTEEDGADIGLFWFSKADGAGMRRIMHAGGSFGTTSYCEIIPARQTGVILIANDASPATERTLRDMAATILDEGGNKTK